LTRYWRADMVGIMAKQRITENVQIQCYPAKDYAALKRAYVKANPHDMRVHMSSVGRWVFNGMLLRLDQEARNG